MAAAQVGPQAAAAAAAAVADEREPAAAGGDGFSLEPAAIEGWKNAREMEAATGAGAAVDGKRVFMAWFMPFGRRKRLAGVPEAAYAHGNAQRKFMCGRRMSYKSHLCEYRL